ncbi:caspase family protein [Bacteroidales bacterium OttesenSCG-928-B11]|nr:caspase family protein [Bacteroidales bacterium OttesenSCG-928-C03]MDL2312027.1 caspase family protein [Bacteroidales bacterium OttesenSCG-928-B11]
MRKVAILFIFILLSSLLTAQNKCALVIGIGQYPAESGWSEINGNNDIDIVTTFLIDNGFSKENIVILKNEQATKNRIIREIKKITELSKEGDFIYIHFSGHGQQVTDLDGDEEDGFDEAWIPYDAKKEYKKGYYEGENHLIDDEINALLKEIKKKIGGKGGIVVVVDACNSGDSSRGEEEETEEIVIRGTADKFIIQDVANTSKKVKIPIEWVEISACKSYQNNHECVINGKNYGSLSYSLYSQRSDLPNIPLELVEKMINRKMREFVSSRIQSVQIQSPESSSGQILFKK